MAKGKHSPRSFPPSLLVSCNNFLLHSKWCKQVCTQPPTSHQRLTVNEAGNLDRSVYNLEIQGCITGQVNKQDTLRLSVQSHSQGVQILTAYLSPLVLTSRAAGEPMPRNGNCHSTPSLPTPPGRSLQGPGWSGLGPPPRVGAALVAQRDKALELLKGGHHVVAPGGDVVVCAAPLPRVRVPPTSSNPASPCRMLTNPSLVQAF